MTPVLFVSHGAPTTVMEPEAPFGAALRGFGERVRPQAIAIVSAHWQTRAPSVRVTGAARPPLIYDFGGFPDAMYRMQYAAPGAPELAREIADALASSRVDGAPKWAAEVDDTRGWDHGVWTALKLAYPAADVPVVQLSLPTASPAALLAMGRALLPLRARDVLVVGSGTVVHNLRAMGAEAPWARAFDAWFADAIARHDLEALADWRARAPEAARAHPTSEHFDPFLVAAGATEAGEPVTTLYDELAFGSLSMRTLTVG
ncbi:MAG TPA: class III extradiol ring-cleavage dioxygenase [Polyangia bacterium]|jgi:4,5-DOPA dioxygenase extradiol